MKMWAGAIKCTFQCHVIVAWCPFIVVVKFFSHLPSFSLVLHPSVLNMFLWDLFASHSVIIIIIFLLTASRLSDALPVDALPPHAGRPRHRCRDQQPTPCICDGMFGIGEGPQIDKSKCGSIAFDFKNPPDPRGVQLMSWASHPLVLHWRQ
jgi:hypothetical protein